MVISSGFSQDTEDHKKDFLDSPSARRFVGGAVLDWFGVGF